MGHDFSRTCISYAMEVFASKVAKAVFISAAMLTNGQSAVDMFTQRVDLSYSLPFFFSIFLENIGDISVTSNTIIM